MRRDRPWRRDAPDAVIVARPSRWGNPFTVAAHGSRAAAVAAYERWIAEAPEARALLAAHGAEIAGRDLACWCPLDQPCHADVLLRLVNGT